MEMQMKRAKQKKSDKQGFHKRSPLQHLNGLQFHKSFHLSSSSSSNSVVAPKFLLPSKTSAAPSLASSSNSSSSSTRSRLDRRATKVSYAVTQNVMTGSEENEVPRRPFTEKLKTKEQQCLDNMQYGKSTAKFTCHQTDRRSKQCGQRNAGKSLKIGSGELAAKLKSSQRNSSGEPPIKRFGLSIKSSLVSAERCTPGGKIATKGVSDFCRLDDCKNARENSVSKTGSGEGTTSVKTPPMEASLSPEIQCGSHAKLVALKSAATPICYGAGHLLSGVTDKRKCRRRGSLRGGCEKVNLFDDDEENDKNVISNSLDSSVPLLAEASVRWLLSPCDEGHENQGSDSENRCKMNPGNASLAFDLLSSPSTLCGNVSDLEISNKKIDPLLAATPSSTSNCNRTNVIGNNSAFSLGFLSSGNMIQTPSSDSSLYGSNVVGQHSNCVEFELDSISIWDAPSLSFQCADMYSSSESIIPIQLQKNGHSVCSWMSDSTLENLALSQTRVSWRDGLVSKIDENDCCPCLSNEEIDAVHCSDEQLMSYGASQSVGYKENDLGIKHGENEANAMKMDLDVSHPPIVLEYEPCISARGKEKLSEDRLNECAESICTNGGDLAASCDSDWT